MNINALLDKLILTKNYKEYTFAYNTHPSPSPYYKSIMLLHLLTTNKVEYYKLLQSITYEESESDDIKFIIHLDLLLNTCNLKKIRDLKVGGEIEYFIEKVISQTLQERKEVEVEKEDYYKNVIIDSMFVINHLNF